MKYTHDTSMQHRKIHVALVLISFNLHVENTTLCKLMKTNLYVKAIQAWVIYNIIVIMSFATVFFLSIKCENAL